MKPSELLLKALEYKSVPDSELETIDLAFQQGERCQNIKIQKIIRDSGVLDVLDAADEIDECEPENEQVPKLWEKLNKLRERLKQLEGRRSKKQRQQFKRRRVTQ